MNFRAPRLFGAVWISILVLKLALSLTFGLSFDEAYYWTWSLVPSLSYYDHPGMVSWLMTTGTWVRSSLEFITGLKFDSAVRWPFVLMAHSTLLIADQIFTRLHSFTNRSNQNVESGPGQNLPSIESRIGLLIVLSISPFIGVGSMVATPDIPLVFFASTVGLMVTILMTRSETSFWFLLVWSCLSGLFVGLGLLSKYHMILVAPALIFAVTGCASSNRQKLIATAVGVVMAAIVACPILIWNIQNDFSSIRFQLAHGLADLQSQAFSERLARFFEYFGIQILLFTPGLIFLLKREYRTRFRLSFWLLLLGPLVFFGLSSLRAPVEVNWPITSHLFVYIALWVTPPLNRWVKSFATIWVLAFVIVMYQAYHADEPLFGLTPQKLKTFEFVRYRPLCDQVCHHPQVYASTYQMAAQLSFQSRRLIPKLRGIDRRDHFDLISESEPTQDGGLLVVEQAQDRSLNIENVLKQRGFSVDTREEIHTQFENFIVYHFERTGLQ